jgi:multidrug efflux system membrane fusion protein
VLSGVKPGDRVVIDGTDRLRDGAKVEITEAASTEPASAAHGRGGYGHRMGGASHAWGASGASGASGAWGHHHHEQDNAQ